MKLTHEERIWELAAKFNTDVEIVRAVSEVLGESEDYDGLPNLLEEYGGLMNV